MITPSHANGHALDMARNQFIHQQQTNCSKWPLIMTRYIIENLPVTMTRDHTFISQYNPLYITAGFGTTNEQAVAMKLTAQTFGRC